jgi:hypothetical protein
LRHSARPTQPNSLHESACRLGRMLKVNSARLFLRGPVRMTRLAMLILRCIYRLEKQAAHGATTVQRQHVRVVSHDYHARH